MNLIRLSALILAVSSMTARAAEPLPVEAFAALPRVASVALSPNGAWYAGVVHQGEATLVVARSVAGGDKPAVLMRIDEPQVRVNWLRFVSDTRIVASVAYANQRGWNQVNETRLLAIDRDGQNMKALVEPTRWQRDEMVALHQDEVIDWLPEDGHHLLLAVQEDKRNPGRAVFEVDVDTGRRTLVRPAKSRVNRWITDQAHQLRVSVAQDGDDVTVQVADPDGSHWRTAWTYRASDRDAVQPLGFGDDPNLLFIKAGRDGGRRAVFEVDLRDPALPRRLVLGDPRSDVGGRLVVDPKAHKVIGVGGVASSAGHFWDADAKALVAAIDTALPGQANRLLQLDATGVHYLVFSSGNGVPGRFMVGDRATNHLAVVAEQYPGLPPGRMSRKTAVTLKARDGLALPAYLALPVGAAGKNLPTVILPQGDPIASASLDFDPGVEFLTDRGYAVLQIAFRGSAGHGDDLRDAGLKRFGLEMQDDLSDAVAWLVDRGTADPSRVCVVGAGFGGYAALMAGAKTPGLYRCVASFAGVTDLIELGSTRAHFFNGKAMFESLVGSAWDDRARLKETSPLHLAAQFRAPVLLVHGTADLQVPFEQSAEMADALKSAGKDVRLVTQQDGDHGLSFPAYRIEFFRELDAFLAKNLAVPATTAGLAPTARP